MYPIVIPNNPRLLHLPSPKGNKPEFVLNEMKDIGEAFSTDNHCYQNCLNKVWSFTKLKTQFSAANSQVLRAKCQQLNANKQKFF